MKENQIKMLGLRLTKEKNRYQERMYQLPDRLRAKVDDGYYDRKWIESDDLDVETFLVAVQDDSVKFARTKLKEEISRLINPNL